MFRRMQSVAALLVLLALCSEGQRSERRKSPIQSVPVSADVKKAVDFDCPEEFGYYPHPTDCTQYYVCVFGGALLESCTGGLMYSHELQTCDWPRNVGCNAAGEVAETPSIQQQTQTRNNKQQQQQYQQQQQQHVATQVSRAPQIQRVTIQQAQPQQHQPQPQSQRIRVQAQPPPPPRPSPNPVVTSRGQPTHINHQEIVKQQLYADVDEQLPPAEELENDGQQRVLRGQPSSLGAVQRDRDGLSPNTIRQGKVGSFSFGSQIDRDEILQNYSDSDLTDVIEHWTEPTNYIEDFLDNPTKDNNNNIRKKRDTVDDELDYDDSDDSRNKRQTRFERVITSNQNGRGRWNDQKKKQSEYIQFPNSQYNAGTPFKPSAQITDGFSPLTGSGINLQKNPTQYLNYQTNDNTFKPLLDSVKQYSTVSGNFNSFSSSTPSYAYFTLNPKDSKSPFIQSTTLSPLIKDNNYQYYSLKPSNIITKSPPISTLKSSSHSPFAALSGGFYNNKPDTKIRHNSKLKNQNSFGNQQLSLSGPLQYDFEVVSKKPFQNTQIFFSTTASPNDIFKPSSQQKPLRPNTRTKTSSSRGKTRSRPNSGRSTNKNKLTRHRKPHVDVITSTSPKYNYYSQEEEDEGNSNENSSEYEENGSKKHGNDGDDIKPAFPEPPEHYLHSVNKYEDIINPFADPNFDFDSFISKVRNTHLSNVPSKDLEKLNQNNNRAPIRNSKVKNEFLNTHHKYEGMSTPRPFSALAEDKPRPTLSTQYEYYDEEEYYDDKVNNDNKYKPILQSTKITNATPSFLQKRPSTSTANKVYSNNFSNSITKVPSQVFSQSENIFKDDARRPTSIRISTKNPNKFVSSTSAKPIFHASFKVTPTLGFESTTQKSVTKYILREPSPTLENFISKRPTTNDFKTTLKFSPTTTKGLRQSTPAPTKQFFSKPTSNDEYYDEDDDDEYYYEPPVKSKFMPSTEVKPQRPPIAQNYAEYEDFDIKVNKKQKQNSKTPINNNETFDNEDEGGYWLNDAQLKKPGKQKPTLSSTTENVYSKYPSITNPSPTKSSADNNFQAIDSVKVSLRPELVSYKQQTSSAVSSKIPATVNKPRYLNQTTLRPYTVRHRLAKPSTTLSTFADIKFNPTKQTTLRYPTRVTQNVPSTSTTIRGTFKYPLIVSSTAMTDNANQETRLTDHDDNAPNRVEPVVSSSPSYNTRQKPSSGRALYNATSLQYDQQYDPYYALYDEDQELYKDADYAQQYNSASQRPTANVQQPYRSTPSPVSPSPSTQHYTPSQQQVYTQQATVEDYDDALINAEIDDNQYQQPIRQSTTSTLDLINELGYGLSTLGGLLRTSISPRVTQQTTTTTTTSPPTIYTSPVTRAPAIQRSTPSDKLEGINPPTNKPKSHETKQQITTNSRYSADNLNSQRLLLQNRRKQMRLVNNNSQEVQASEPVVQTSKYPTQQTKHDVEFTQVTSESAVHEIVQYPSESTVQRLKTELHDSDSTLLDSQPTQSLKDETVKQPQPIVQHTSSAKPPLEHDIKVFVTPTPKPLIPESISPNSLILPVHSSPRSVKNNKSRFLSLTTGFSFKKDNDNGSNEEPSYTLRVYKTPAQIVTNNAENSQSNNAEINSPKASYKVSDLAVENVESINELGTTENVKSFNEDVTERPRPITFIIENLPKPGEKPIVIQLKSQTGPRSRGPRIEQQNIVPLYNRPSNRVFDAPSQDTFIYFKPSPQTSKEISLTNQAVNETTQNKHKVLKSVIKRPTTTPTNNDVLNSDDSNPSETDTESFDVDSQPRTSSKSNQSKEVNDFVPKDIVPPNNRRNNIGTLPNALLRRKSFREAFNAKTESSLSNQPNVSPYKTLENLLKDEKFDRTTPINRFYNNVIATTPDPQKVNIRKGNPTPVSQPSDQQPKDTFVSPTNARAREGPVRIRPTRPSTLASTQPTEPLVSENILSNAVTQEFLNNLYKYSASMDKKQDVLDTKDETEQPEFTHRRFPAIQNVKELVESNNNGRNTQNFSKRVENTIQNFNRVGHTSGIEAVPFETYDSRSESDTSKDSEKNYSIEKDGEVKDIVEPLPKYGEDLTFVPRFDYNIEKEKKFNALQQHWEKESQENNQHENENINKNVDNTQTKYNKKDEQVESISEQQYTPNLRYNNRIVSDNVQTQHSQESFNSNVRDIVEPPFVNPRTVSRYNEPKQRNQHVTEKPEVKEYQPLQNQRSKSRYQFNNEKSVSKNVEDNVNTYQPVQRTRSHSRYSGVKKTEYNVRDQTTATPERYDNVNDNYKSKVEFSNIRKTEFKLPQNTEEDKNEFERLANLRPINKEISNEPVRVETENNNPEVVESREDNNNDYFANSEEDYKPFEEDEDYKPTERQSNARTIEYINQYPTPQSIRGDYEKPTAKTAEPVLESDKDVVYETSQENVDDFKSNYSEEDEIVDKPVKTLDDAKVLDYERQEKTSITQIQRKQPEQDYNEAKKYNYLEVPKVPKYEEPKKNIKFSSTYRDNIKGNKPVAVENIDERVKDVKVNAEYDVGSNEYEYYEDPSPKDRNYNVRTTSAPTYVRATTSIPLKTRFTTQTTTTTTTTSTTTPKPETPSTTPEVLWSRVTQRNRVTVTSSPDHFAPLSILSYDAPPPTQASDSYKISQRNRVTATKSPYRSRGGSPTTESVINDYESADISNEVNKFVDDYEPKVNQYYDEQQKHTIDTDNNRNTNFLPTLPPQVSVTTSIPQTSLNPITTPAPSKSNSFRPSSVKSSVNKYSSSSSPTTPSSRALRVNNDIKSKAIASQRSFLPNKCTDVKCNNNNHLQRTNTRGRGSAHYSTSSDNEASVNTNRGTPPTSNRGRPTLKPSTAIVSKAQEFVDIYRFPPSRPDNVYPTPQVDKTAAKCRKDVCLLPDCSCGGKDIPGNLHVEEVPQIVLITFDDAVNDLNKQTYSDIFERGRKNPNGCPITGTFYVSHEWTDYSQVQNLYADGHEMASHTVSHSFGEQFSQKKWNREVGGQREILAAYGGVKLEDVRGMRAPFLSVGGNKMFKMLYDSNFTYDSSMPVYENRPPSWPYTLDYKIFHDCMIPPCPTKSYPGVWEVPMVMWQDLNGGRCSMGDACSNPPTAEGVYKMLLKNFDRHYTTNRAPFGLFYHAAWFTQPHHKEGFIMFLDTINSMKDVFLVTNWQAIQWVRDPTPLSRINSFQPFHCNYQDRPKRCNNPKVCNLWHKSGVRYMRTCQPCPDIYPWTGKTGIRSSRIDNEIEE